MEKQEILALMKEFERSGLSVMEVRDEKGGVRFEKAAAAQTAPVLSGTEVPAGERPAAEDSGCLEVKAPLVGVFYQAAAPDQEPFVREGEKVEKGQTLCLVEAMKMMNELKSPLKGTIRRIMAQNGEMVEYDQVLFEVEPC